MYDFSLDKKSFGLLVAGSALLGLLVFIAGLLVGANWNTHPAETIASGARQQPALVSEAEQPATPKEPVLTKEPDAKEEAHASAPAETAKPAKQQDGTPTEENKKESSTTAALAPGGEAKIIQTTDADATDMADSNEEAADKRVAFSVQVGVFLEAEKASQFVAEMEGKGYTPSIFVANDAENRQWYTVRIGAYANQAEATQAATNFTKQEKIKAVVRPANSL
jgi:cell division protein FtsN